MPDPVPGNREEEFVSSSTEKTNKQFLRRAVTGPWESAHIVPFCFAVRADYSIRVKSKLTGAQGTEDLAIFGELGNLS